MKTLLGLLLIPAAAAPYIDGGGAQITLPEIILEFHTVTLVEIEKADVVVVRVRMVPRAHARQQQEQRHAACQQKALAPGRQLHAASTARETS